MNLLLAFVFLPIDSPAALSAALFVVLVLSGVGLPVPEEVTLIFGGYLAYLEFIDFWTAVYVLTAGIIAADIVGFMLGRYAMAFVLRLLARWRLVEAAFEKVAALFARFGDTIVVLSRPLAGVRVAVPIFAGYTGMPLWKFLALDLAAAIPWTFFLVSLSYYLGSGFDLLVGVRLIRHAFFIFLGLAIVAGIAVRWMKLRA
ncbi:MAG: DedA family protein [Patescibacteria group bacterium]